MSSSWIAREKREAIYKSDGHRCIYCGASAPDATLTLDHLHPQVLGGRHEAQNLVTASLSCNSARQEMPVEKFVRRLERMGFGTAKEISHRIRLAVKRHARIETARPVRITTAAALAA